MTMALVACGTTQSSPDSEAVETVKEVVESADTENSEAVSETEQATEAPVDEVVETVDETVESESSEATSETENSEAVSTPETSTEENSEAVSEPDSEAVVEPEFTVTEVTATKYATQSVNVRSGPSTDYDKIGGLTTNQEITVNGVCDQTGWFRFDLNGTVAFVSNRYVSDSKVEKPAASETPSNGGNSTAGTGSVASNWADSYPKNQWIDMGEYFFYIANSQPEANQVCGDYMGSHTTGSDGHLYHTDLNARYPDRKLYTGAWTTQKGNIPIVVVSTVTYDGNGNVVYLPKFIWE